MKIWSTDKGRRAGSKKGYNKGCFGNPQPSHYTSEEMSKGGRGNKDEETLKKVKQYLRAHREGVTAVEIGNFVGVSQARATRLLDLLSGNSDDNSFLVYVDDEGSDPLYYIHKDNEGGV